MGENNVTNLLQKINDVNVNWFRAEVLADHLEDRPFHNERIVNGPKADTILAVPAGLATTGDARVHNVITNEKIGLHLESVVNGASSTGTKEEKQTHSTDQPRTAALKYSSSVSSRPLRMATDSTTLRPRLSFPPGTLYFMLCRVVRPSVRGKKKSWKDERVDSTR